MLECFFSGGTSVVKCVNFILNFLILRFHLSKTTKHVFMAIVVYSCQRRLAPLPSLSCLFSVMGIGNTMYIFRAMVIVENLFCRGEYFFTPVPNPWRAIS